MAARLGDVGAGDAPAGRRSGLRRRAHQRAGLSAGAAVQHLLLDARLRHVSARGRAEVRPSRCPRSARGPKPGTSPVHQRPAGRGRAQRRNAVLAEDPSLFPSLTRQGSRAPGARDLPRALRRRRPDAHASGSTRPRPVSTAERRSMPPAGWAACGWSNACSHAAACRSTPGIRPIRARRSAGPRSDPSIAGPAGADYPAVAERLVAAGADITAVGNGAGRTLLEMAQGNRSMQDALRRLGAT